MDVGIGRTSKKSRRKRVWGEKRGDMRLFVYQFAYNRNDTGRRGEARRD